MYYAGGVIKLFSIKVNSGENYGGEGVAHEFEESYLYLAQMTKEVKACRF